MFFAVINAVYLQNNSNRQQLLRFAIFLELDNGSFSVHSSRTLRSTMQCMRTEKCFCIAETMGNWSTSAKRTKSVPPSAQTTDSLSLRKLTALLMESPALGKLSHPLVAIIAQYTRSFFTLPTITDLSEHPVCERSDLVRGAMQGQLFSLVSC